MHSSLELLQRPEPNWVDAYRVSDYVRASARRWKLSILLAAVGFGVAFGACWLYPDTYISYAQLLFLPPQVSETSPHEVDPQPVGTHAVAVSCTVTACRCPPHVPVTVTRSAPGGVPALTPRYR